MAKAKRIFINDEFGSYSRTAIRGLKKSEALEIMEAWFRQRYEDPVHRTPNESAEGGYQYIYGGPYDAREELDGQFYDLFPEAWIEAVVDELEHECMEWTETSKPEDYDEDEFERQEIHLGEMGSEPELALRREFLEHLSLLERMLADREWPPIGIGHNQPPTSIAEIDETQIEELEDAVGILKGQFSSENPSVLSILPQEQVVARFSAHLKSYLGPKADLAADEFAKQLGKTAASPLF